MTMHKFHPLSMPFPFGGGWLEIGERHYKTLRRSNWLSGVVIEWLGLMLQYELGRCDTSWLYTSTYFWQFADRPCGKSTNPYSYGKNVLDYNHVVVPINKDGHWSLAVIENIKSPGEKVPYCCTIWHADSYGLHTDIDLPLRTYLRSQVLRESSWILETDADTWAASIPCRTIQVLF
ncbi:hypothetical protein CLOM_g7735 [Closterium sp. NIES-68]|nr:hypothetical protein CLOM_g13526 [Closterium sp. NIES-68]GJP48455.1 hypothetical protein CLOM_g7735 [Closterium sp. NIES-68]